MTFHIPLRGVVGLTRLVVVANEGQRIDIPDGCILENRLLSGNLNMIVSFFCRTHAVSFIELTSKPQGIVMDFTPCILDLDVNPQNNHGHKLRFRLGASFRGKTLSLHLVLLVTSLFCSLHYIASRYDHLFSVV